MSVRFFSPHQSSWLLVDLTDHIAHFDGSGSETSFWVVGSIPTTGFRFQVSGNRSRIEGRFNSVFSRVAHEVNDLVRAIGRPSGVIDDMFNGADKQAVRCDVVAVDDHTGIGSVGRPAHSIAVVCPPGPDVVQQDVVAVDHEARGGLAQGRAANAEEHVLNRRRIGWVALVGVPGTHLQQHR